MIHILDGNWLACTCIETQFTTEHYKYDMSSAYIHEWLQDSF